MVLVAGGAAAALELLFLANIGFVASQCEWSSAAASLVVGLGLLGALAAWTWLRGVHPPVRARSVAGLAAVGLAWALPALTGPAAAVVAIALQVAVGVLLAIGLDRAASGPPDPGRLVGAATGGSLLFLALVLLWQLHIDQPLPVPRQSIPALAAAVVGAIAVRAGPPAAVDSRRGAIAPAVAISAVVLALAGWLWLSAPSGDGTIPPRSEVRLVSYNVRGAVDTDGQLRPDRVAHEIRSSDPDVVVLQEVARGWPIHGALDLLALLSRDLDMGYVFVRAADGQFGNAVLSRLPMSEVVAAALPDDGTQERSYAIVEVITSQGPLVVAATHLQTRSVPQVTALLDAVGDVTPAVIAGDMNLAPGDPEVALFTSAGLVDAVGATGDPCRTTSDEPTSACDRPDWVFVTPDVEVAEVRIGTTVASDHLAIHVTVVP